MTKLKMIFVLALFSLTLQYGYADSDVFKAKTNLGLYGNLNINMQTPNFKYQLPNGTLYVPFDENKTSMGASFGLIGNFPINDMFVISGRLGYNGLSGDIEKTLDGVKYKVSPKFNLIEISPTLEVYNLTGLKPLYFLGGLELGIPMNEKYSLDSANKTLIDNEKFDNSKTRLAIALGLGYHFALSKTVNLIPEISYRLPLTQVSGNKNFDSWNVPQLRIGVALTFNLNSGEDKTVSKYTGESKLDVGFRGVNAYDRDGNKTPVNNIRVEDVKYSELFPLLPYIFFNENEDTPAKDYQTLYDDNQRGEFNINTLEPNAETINMRTADIMGKRMLENSDASLIITGTNDFKKERSNKGISQRRAQNVKDYLVNTYKIDESRITVKAVNLPAKASASTVDDGMAENRRVEFSGENQKLFEPIIISSENQRVAVPDIIEFQPYAESTDSIKIWTLEISQGGKNLRTFRGNGRISDQKWNISPNILANKELPIEYTLVVENTRGVKKVVNGKIPVEYYSFTRKKSDQMPDKLISKFSLVLFDFNKAEISPLDMDIIDKNIVPALQYNSTIDIYGYTDRIGDEKYNKELATKRANAVKNILEAKVKDAKYIVHGVGESAFIFDNDSPIGRQLSRTVQVVISTPK